MHRNFGSGGDNESNADLLNTIFLGEVATVHNYGAFVKIPGNRNQGLIHRTQISNAAVDDASDVLQSGERVYCKAIAITEDNKISLSMKVVDQGNGRDLDPNGVQAAQDEQRRKTYDPHSRKKAIELGAVLNTVCSRCGTRGHLKKDCFGTKEGKTYELLPDDDVDELPPALPEQPEILTSPKHKTPKQKKEKKKKKKQKKEKLKKSKKQKKSKKKRRKSSLSESSSSESDSSVEQKRRSHRAESTERKKSVSPPRGRQRNETPDNRRRHDRNPSPSEPLDRKRKHSRSPLRNRSHGHSKRRS